LASAKHMRREGGGGFGQKNHGTMGYLVSLGKKVKERLIAQPCHPSLIGGKTNCQKKDKKRTGFKKTKGGVSYWGVKAEKAGGRRSHSGV